MRVDSLTASLARFAQWASGLFLIFFIIGFDGNGPTIRVDDQQMERRGTFSDISLAIYSGNRATFTHELNSALVAHLARPVTATAFSLRVYNYAKGTNRFAVSLGDSAPIIVGIPSAPEGQIVIRRVLPTPVTADSIKVSMLEIGQDSALIDHLDIETDAFPFARLLDLALFSLLLAAILAFSPKVLVIHAASAGRNFLFIDYMRGIAATLVLLHHARGYSQLPDFDDNPWFAVLAKNGHLGVEIFYFVSAYTLTLSLLNQRAPRGTGSAVLEFWLRRLARIMPAFLFVLLIMVAVRPLMYPEVASSVSTAAILSYVFMTYVFHDSTLNEVIQHSVWWSISTELQFYILLPMFASAAWLSIAETGRLALRWRIFIGIGLFVLGILVAVQARQILAATTYSPYMALYHFDVFAAGIGLAVILNGQRAAEMPRIAPVWKRWLMAAAWMGLLLCVVASFQFVTGLAAVRPFGVQLLTELDSKRVVFAVGVAMVVLLADWTERRFSVHSPWSPLRALGVLSFVTYLVHIPVLQITQRYLVPAAFASSEQVYAAMVAIALIICLFLGFVIHRLVEIPSMDLVRNLSLRPVLLSVAHIYVVIVALLFFWK